MRLFILFVLIPFTELYILLKVGSFIGPGLTIAIILVTAAIGYRLFRAQGLAKLQKMRSTLSGAGAASGGELAMDMAEGAAILVAGILLLTPGFVTDAFGFACLIPPIRKWIIKKVVSNAVIKTSSSFQFHASSKAQNHQQDSNANKQNSRVIEGEYREKK